MSMSFLTSDGGLSMHTKILAGVTLAALTTMALVPAPHNTAGGTVSGKVTYTGTPPKMKPIDMAKEPSCAKEHATPVMNESVVTGSGNTLGDVVVYISAGGTFDQKGCQYIPHVLAMQAGQQLEIKNDDQTSHNIHPMSKVNPEWNKSQPPGAPPIEVKYEKPEFIPVKCNVHPWMHGYFAVLNTSHSAVTGSDGTFSLTGLPPGKYTVTAWQERFGTQSQEVTITGNETAKLDFVLKATEY
jgi:plastocyanin